MTTTAIESAAHRIAALALLTPSVADAVAFVEGTVDDLIAVYEGGSLSDEDRAFFSDIRSRAKAMVISTLAR